MDNVRHYEAPESVKYHGGYDPSDPPEYDDEAADDEEVPVEGNGLEWLRPAPEL